MSPENRGLDIFDMIADIVQAKQRSWRQHAACRGMGVEHFFPRQHHVGLHAIASRTCASCPVTEECRKEWESMPAAIQRHGYWYGTTDKERRAL